MNTLQVSRLDIDFSAYKMRSARESDYSTFVTDDTLVYEGDQLMIAHINLDMDCSRVIHALKSIKYSKGYRTSGLPSTSRIFGYSPRVAIRNDFCTATALAVEQPDYHAVITEYAAKVADYYRRLNPDLYQAHDQTTTEHVADTWRIKDSPFTSGIINKNNPLKYHFDTGNFADVWSCMLVFKGDVDGGFLSVPEYGLGFELKNNSLFMFDGQGLMHGVTPIRKNSRNAFRYSIVYYSLRQMWNCLPITDELLRIRQKRTEREEKRAQG